MEFSCKRIVSSVFDFAFLITRDNLLISHLHHVEAVVQLFQMHAFCLGPDVGWNAPIVESIAGIVLGRVHNEVLFYVAWAFVALQCALLILSVQQLASSAASSLLTLLRFLRFAMSLSATLLFFPIMETLLWPVHATLNGDSIPPQLFVLAILGVLLFLLPVLLVTLLWFDPDPNLVRKAASMAPYQQMITLTLNVVLIASTLFVIKPTLVAVLLNNCALTLFGLARPCAHHFEDSQFSVFGAISSVSCK